MTTTSKPLSKTAAKAQAHRESHMYRQGGGWVVSVWSDARGMNVVTGEMSYERACGMLTGWRDARALDLAGLLLAEPSR